ncbi:MAG: SpoIIE family protein phosphatase [Spirochaetales bacterium]|nr:SpoIIE family protein phosphatase [Spirochaetales bacterium]
MLFFNDWGIATLICCVFTLLLFGYLAYLPNKTTSTRLLVVFYLGAFVLDFGFLLSALLPEPVGAYHRFVTVPGAFIPLIAIVQFAYYYPRLDHARESRIVLVLSILLGLALVADFFWRAYDLRPSFDFAGEIFNYPNEVGSRVAIGILAFVLWFIVVMTRKLRLAKSSSERRALWQLLLAVLIPSLVPGIANLLFQSGRIEHSTFQQIFVVTTLLGYFALTIVFINNTVERTSFMTKIVGISVVTILLVVQALATVINRQNKENFDNFHVLDARSHAAAILRGSEEAYVLAFPLSGQPDDSVSVLYNESDYDLDLEQVRTSFLDTLATANFERRLPRAVDPRTTELFFAYHVMDEANGRVLEVGYPYLSYRRFVDGSARKIAVITLILVVIILALYPIFFSRNLVRPLNTLLEGVGEVNTGNLEVRIPVMVQDEIGYLSESFNGMVRNILEGKRKLEDYANTLESKVKERTREVVDKMQTIEKLKIQQDGDYYLTALIARPLTTNWNKSSLVATDFHIEQKKKFAFRRRESELGGDICISGNLRFGGDADRYVMFCNADAMGKSMQGAGGAIVMGTAMNHIMSRSAGRDRILQISPEEWLRRTYHELNDIFSTFDGSMSISAFVGLIHEKSGTMLFFNAEHPWTVLYRNGAASFIEEELMLRKIGLESEFDLQLQTFQLEPGDVLFTGSDGRDDLDLTPESEDRVINEDHDLFRRLVEQGKGDLKRIVLLIKEFGELTDDLSLIRVGFQETSTGPVPAKEAETTQQSD